MLPEGYETDRVFQMETNLDDTPPEHLGYAVQKLLDAGALDVWTTPVQMKKQRPGIVLSVLCEHPRLQTLADLLFRETSAFGARIWEVQRLKLHRDFLQVDTRFGPISVKRGFKDTNILLQLAPEFESCRAAAEKHGVPLQEVYSAARIAAASTLGAACAHGGSTPPSHG